MRSRVGHEIQQVREREGWPDYAGLVGWAQEFYLYPQSNEKPLEGCKQQGVVGLDSCMEKMTQSAQ